MSKKKINGSVVVFAGLVQALASQSAAAMGQLTPIDDLSAEIRVPVIEKINQALAANPALSENENLSFFVDSEGKIYAFSNSASASESARVGEPSCVGAFLVGEPSCVIGNI